MDKIWQILGTYNQPDNPEKKDNNVNDGIIQQLLQNRGLKTNKQIAEFLDPPDPENLNPDEVGINNQDLTEAIKRIHDAVKNNESIVVYADYDADGITAGAIMWETLYKLGAKVMPYIPHRTEEGYGLSVKGLETIQKLYKPKLIITVDHGITGKKFVELAKSLGMEIIITDHHVKPPELPKCIIVHTTLLSGAGVSWFVAKELLKKFKLHNVAISQELLALHTIGTVADIIPLIGVNRAIVKHGLAIINRTNRVGLNALIKDAGLTKGKLTTFDISHMLAPRLNAMGRLEHALDALRLLCTGNEEKAQMLAQKLGLKNRERQQLTSETTTHAFDLTRKVTTGKKLIFVADKTYNPGIIGLVAGKLVEEYYRPSVVIAEGPQFSKGSARSISGFNIVEAIRKASGLLVDVGGHPMAAGFTVETKNIPALKVKLEDLADLLLTPEILTRKLIIDLAIPLSVITKKLWLAISKLAPFGFGNYEPVFVTSDLKILDVRLVGTDGKHLKLKVVNGQLSGKYEVFDAIAFGFGKLYPKLKPEKLINLAYSIDLNIWQDTELIQLKVKDIQIQ